MKKIIFLAAFFSSIWSYSQNNNPWIEQDVKKYAGVYHFGISEWESSLYIFVEDDLVCAQLRYGRWSEDHMNWENLYENFKNFNIKGNNVTAKDFTGKFVTYSEDGYTKKGLYTETKRFVWDENGYEIGEKTGLNISIYFSGEYPQASLRKLKDEDFVDMSKQQMKIMRNEIYARYGYIFIAGGEMDKYFRQQEW